MDTLIVDKSDLQHWESKNTRLIPRLEEMLGKGVLKEGHTPYVLTGLYRDQAIIEFLKGNLAAYYENLGKVVDTFGGLIDEFSDNPGAIRQGFLSHAFYLPLVCAVLLNDREKLNFFCKKYSGVLQLDREQFFTDFSSALYFLAVGDTHRALECGRQAKDNAIDDCRALVDLLICVAENNQNRLGAEWEAALFEFKKYVKSESQGMPESAIFMDGLALLMLNKNINKVTFFPMNNEPMAPISIL